LFQCALLSEQGVQWLGYAGGNVVLKLEKGRFVQRNIITEEMLPLMSIWEWAQERPLPGTFGTFEDLSLVAAVERIQRDTDSRTDSSTKQQNGTLPAAFPRRGTKRWGFICSRADASTPHARVMVIHHTLDRAVSTRMDGCQQ